MLKGKTLLILGAGGHGKSVAEAALLSGQWKKIVFADDSWPEKIEIAGFPIISDIVNIHRVREDICAAIPAVGSNSLRVQWSQQLTQLDIPITTIIHPLALVSATAEMGRGVCIMAGCIIGVDTIIEEGVILNLGTLIDHDCRIGKFSHLSVGVKLTGNKTIAPFTFLEAGTVLAHEMGV